jgi:hypothetical protein
VKKDTDTKLCYMCEKPGSTTEHIPPRCFFPEKEEFRKNLITVHSCPEHNNGKSEEDEYMRILFVGTTTTVPDAELTGSTIRSLRRKKRLARDIEWESQTRKGYAVDENRINAYLTCIAKGVYRHAFDEKFNGSVNIITHFLDNFTKKRDLRKWNKEAQRAFMWRRLFAAKPLLPELPWAGENPDIFRYRIARSDTGGMLEIEFYLAHRVDCIFTTTTVA